jgi:hypothetical protein
MQDWHEGRALLQRLFRPLQRKQVFFGFPSPGGGDEAADDEDMEARDMLDMLAVGMVGTIRRWGRWERQSTNAAVIIRHGTPDDPGIHLEVMRMGDSNKHIGEWRKPWSCVSSPMRLRHGCGLRHCCWGLGKSAGPPSRDQWNRTATHQHPCPRVLGGC